MASDSIQIPGYEVLRPIGSGGMSNVYLAMQRSLERKVAVKVMRRSFDPGVDAGQIEKRFLLEGRTLAKLPHRNIVAVYDIVSNDQLAYIAMEYLGGGVLSDRMRSGLSLAEAVPVIVQIASALEFAHNRGVVHRDLKPANIMFRDSGTPVLTDFGIARSQDGSTMRLTQTGMLVGTPTYMSPEQINGVAVDGRADQYSLGILFYELLTGAPPFRAETSIAVLMAHLSQPLPALPPEFRAFDDVIARMLAKNRDDRYPNLTEFSEDLKSRLINSDTLLMRLQVDPNQPSSEQLRALGFSTSTPGAGPREATGRTPPPRATASAAGATPRSGRTPLIVAAVVLLALIVAAGAWSMFGKRADLSSAEREELVSVWLARADQRIGSGQLMTAKDANDSSAFQYVQKVLEKEPGNAKAQTLLDTIATQLRTQAETAFVNGKAEEAAALVAQGLQVRPQDAALLALKSRLDQVRKPVTPPPPTAAATPPGADAMLPTQAAPTTTAPATAAAPNTAAATTVAPAPTPATADAAKPAGSERGELLLNALPWANVESVVDEAQAAVKLPADASTPFVLPLPTGKYVVTYRNPFSGGKAIQVTATVEANRRANALASFATTSTQGYLSRAGW
jgi:serine/threonine protein kinase